MGKLIYYEWLKLKKTGIVWIFFLLLLVGNVVAAFLVERNEYPFQYVYGMRGEYEDYLAAGESEIYYYSMLDEELDAYLESYDDFLDGMVERAAKSKVLLGGSKNSFAYRNLDKTVADYEPLSGAVTVEKGDNYGVEQYSGYSWGIFFAAIFLAVLVYYLIFRERNQGLLLLLKGTKRGHAPMIGAKLILILLAETVYTLLQELGTLALFWYIYGYPDIGRSIQSISIFRNCTLAITIGQGLVLTVFVRILIIWVVTMLVFALSIAVRNEFAALVASAAFLGVEYVAYIAVGISSSLNFFKCVNPFFCWDMESLLGIYQNLNIFGYPVGKSLCAFVVALVLSAASAVVGIVSFHLSCQVRREGSLLQLRIWFRRHTAFLWRHVGILRFELAKVFSQQRKGLVLAVLLAYCISESLASGGTKYYKSSEEAYYHSYLTKISGRVTDESLDFVQERQDYIDDLFNQMYYLEDPTGEDYYEFLYLQSQYEAEEGAVEMLSTQVETLEGYGDVYGEYLVDELFYMSLWEDYGYDILLGAIGLICAVLWISGIYPADEKKQILPLFSSMKNGRKTLRRSKNICAAIGTAAAFVLSQVPVLVRYCRVDLLSVWQHQLSHFSTQEFKEGLTIGGLLALAFLLKALLFAVVCVLCIILSRRTKNEMAVNILGIGIIAVVALILYFSGVSITSLLMQMQHPWWGILYG